MLSANNDNRVRLLDVATCRTVAEIPLQWAANYSTANPAHRCAAWLCMCLVLLLLQVGLTV